MTGSSERRRSERIPAAHKMMLVVADADITVSKEVVTTVLISKYGAQVRGRRAIDPAAAGRVMNLGSCREAKCRVAWHLPSTSHPGFFDTGLEFLDNEDFWGCKFSEYHPVMTATQAKLEKPSVSSATPSELTPRKLLEHLRMAGSSPNANDLNEALWCGLVEQLEQRRVFTRNEMVSTLKRLGVRA